MSEKNEKKRILYNARKNLILASVLILIACPGCPPHPTVIHELMGSIRVVNDCDGESASIPDKVVVWGELTNASGSVGAYGSVTVNLQQDPADPINPVKVGIYSLQVKWPPSAGTPTLWKAPLVLIPGHPKPPSVTPIDLKPWMICTKTPQIIPCPPGTGPCEDMVPPIGIPPANPPFPTAHDIEVVCSCN
jgi:hypothetical protein